MNVLSCHINTLVADLEHPERDAALGVIADAGFDTVGLPPGVSREQARALREALRPRGLQAIVFVVQRPGADVSSADADERRAGRALLDSALQAADVLGANHITGVPYAAYGLSSVWSSDARAWAAEAVGEFAARSAAGGIEVSVEVLNRYECSALNTVTQALAFRDLCAPAKPSLHLDGFHVMIEEASPHDAVIRAGDGLGILEFGQAGRGALDAGSLDVAALVRSAVAAGFDGPIAFEAFSRSWFAPAVADRLRTWTDLDVSRTDLVRESAHFLRRAVGEGRAERGGLR